MTYAVTLSATGTVPVPPQALGEFTVPVEAANLAQLGLGLAAGLLTHQYNWKQCDFATQVGSPGSGVVVVGVTATCTLQGVPVAEDVVVTFTPA